MLTELRWLALEVKDLAPAVAFYRRHLDLPVRRESGDAVALAAGPVDLVLRRPAGVPRGGLHTHYAFATTPTGYDAYIDRLSPAFDLQEHRFGTMRSLYFYDIAGNCVEIGDRDDGGDAGITGLFEVVLEVASLDRAVPFYEAIGLEQVDVGDDRRRVRLTAGRFDIELWEPHLGLADARGGVHVDLGIAAADPPAVRAAVVDRARRVCETPECIRIVDPDGHSLTIS